jgi:hypothetical protein
MKTKEGTVISWCLEKEQTSLHYRQLIQGPTEIIVPKDHMAQTQTLLFRTKGRKNNPAI